jgi:hypothetical protein
VELRHLAHRAYLVAQCRSVTWEYQPRVYDLVADLEPFIRHSAAIERGKQQLPRRVRRCGGAARVLEAGLVLGRCSSVLLVLRIGASRSWSWGNLWRPEPP